MDPEPLAAGDPPFAELLSFADRVSVVTGAAHGIGAACVRRFAELGASLFSSTGMTTVVDDAPTVCLFGCYILHQCFRNDGTGTAMGSTNF